MITGIISNLVPATFNFRDDTPNTLAEREGFEPSVQLSPDAVLAGLWFQPLTHLSKCGCLMAEGEGFEPPVRLPLLQFSRLPP